MVLFINLLVIFCVDLCDVNLSSAQAFFFFLQLTALHRQTGLSSVYMVAFLLLELNDSFYLLYFMGLCWIAFFIFHIILLGSNNILNTNKLFSCWFS